MWGQEPRRHQVPQQHAPPPPPPSETTEKRASLLRCRDVTGDVDKVGPFRAEDDAGDQDESSDQQKGEEIEQHQESQQHEEGLDTPAKVPCGTEVLLHKGRWTEEGVTCRLTSNQLQCFPPRGEQIEELSGALFEFTQEFGSLPFPGLPFGNRRHPHLLHLPVMERHLREKGIKMYTEAR